MRSDPDAPWAERSLGECIELKRGYDLPKKLRQPGSIPIMTSSGHNGWHNAAKARAPGVVTGRYGTIGEVFYVREDYWPLNTALYVRDFKGSAPRFVAYFLKTVRWEQYTDKAAVPGVNRNHVHMERVRWPPVPEQRRIAAVLGALDDKIELNRKMNQTLEEMAQALFKSWFIDFDGHDPADLVDSELGPIPRGWEVGCLANLQREGKHATTAGPFGSKLTRRHYVEDGVPVIRGLNLGSEQSWFHDDDFVYVSSEHAETLTSNMAFPGDVLFTQRGTLGQVGLIPTDARYERYVISQSQMKLTCAPHVPPFFVYLLFRLPSTISYIKANAVAAGVPHINLSFLRGFPVVIPEASVLARFRKAIEPIYSKIVANSRISHTLAELRDTLLPKLISGEIRVPEAAAEVEAAL